MTETIIPDNTAECRHDNVTLCQSYTEEGRFTAYQCNDCGWVTNKDTPMEAVINGENLPLIDDAMWEQAIARNLRRILKPKERMTNAALLMVRATAYRGV